MLEISTHDYGPHNERLIKKIQNGLNTNYRARPHNDEFNQSLAAAGMLFNEQRTLFNRIEQLNFNCVLFFFFLFCRENDGTRFNNTS